MSTDRPDDAHSPTTYFNLTATCFPDWSAEAVAWQAAQAHRADFPGCGQTVEQMADAMLDAAVDKLAPE